MNEFSQEFEETKRELGEIRGLVIKANNLVNCFSADLKAVGKRQEAYERRLWVNSTAAFVITVLVILVLGKVAWDYRIQAMQAHAEDVQGELDSISTKLEALVTEGKALEQVRSKASAYYQLVRNERWQAIVDGYQDVSTLPLSLTEKAVFADAFREAKSEVSRTAYYEGLGHAKEARFTQAHESFQASLSADTRAPHSPQARFQLARALKEMGRPREAVVILEPLGASTEDPDVLDDAIFLLAMTQIDLKAWDDAQKTLRGYIRRFPKSRKRGLAKLRLAELKLLH